MDYKAPKKFKKVLIPDIGPGINYIGLIIGPRGQTQKELEQKSGCKICVRGKGASKVCYIYIYIFLYINIYIYMYINI